MPVSAVQQATCAFISAIKPMAGCDGVELHISRDSPDADLCSAYRKVSRRVHPDRSGNGEDPKCLNAAHEAWVEAVSTAKGRGGRHAPRSDGADVGGNEVMAVVLPTEQRKTRQERRFHIRYCRVLLKHGAASRGMSPHAKQHAPLRLSPRALFAAAHGSHAN